MLYSPLRSPTSTSSRLLGCERKKIQDIRRVQMSQFPSCNQKGDFERLCLERRRANTRSTAGLKYQMYGGATFRSLGNPNACVVRSSDLPD